MDFSSFTPLPFVSRRTFLCASVLGMSAGIASRGSAKLSATGECENKQLAADVPAVKALVFDVFGTVVDWRTSVAAEVDELAKRKGLTIDGAKFVDAWRAGYGPSMNLVRTGELRWTKLDDLHRIILNRLVTDFRISGLSEDEMLALNRSWHRLRPWPDAVSGLTRMKKKFIIAPLSNGNVSLMTDLAKHAGLPWDCILGAELVHHYKPDPEVYKSAAEFLDLKPGEVMMVAAHLGDLRAARSLGLKTAFVVRPLEFGPNGKPDLNADFPVDISAKDFNDLAGQLGA
jgi:2-haloacid dehalogenase